MKNKSRAMALLLTLAMVLSLLPAGYALEAPEVAADVQPVSQEEVQEPEAPAGEDIQAEEAPAEEDIQVEESPAEEDIQVEESPAEENVQTEEPPAGEDAQAVEPPAQEEDLPEQAEIPEEAIQQETAGMAQAVEGTQGSYAQLGITGTLDYDSAGEVLRLVTGKLKESGKWISGVAMDQVLQNSAMDRAIELAVCYDRDTRPNGESWTTALGDRGVESNLMMASYISAAADAEGAAEELAQAVQAETDLDGFRGAGVGCFVLPDGSQYWVLVLNDIWASGPAQSGSKAGSFPVDYVEQNLGAARLTLSDNALNITETATATLVISNGVGGFTPDGVIYTSSNSKAVTVDHAGALTGVGAGTAVITASLVGTEISVSAQVKASIQLAVTQLTGASNRTGGVQVTWNAVPGATSYEVYRTAKVRDWRGSKIATVPATACSYLDQTAVSGTNYYYTVRACYTNGTTTYRGGYQNPGQSIYCLRAPQVSSVKQNSTGITVSWGTVSGAKRYDVYRKTNGGKWVRLGGVTGNTFLDADVTAKTKYTYTVRAVYGSVRSAYYSGRTVTANATVELISAVAAKAGKCYVSTSTSSKVARNLSAGDSLNVIRGWSRRSGAVTWAAVVFNGVCYYADRSLLLTDPELVSASNVEKGVQVQWKTVAGATGYRVFYKGQTGGWKTVAAVQGGGTSRYVVSEDLLRSGSLYTFTVRAVSGRQVSGYDRTGVSCTFVETPELVRTASNGKDGITITWNRISNADRYRVYRKTTGSWSLVANVTGSSYTDTKVTALTSYIYTVRAVDGKAVSGYEAGGIRGMLVLASNSTTAKALTSVKYRTGAGTSYQTAGTLGKGNSVTILLDGTTRRNGYTWYRAVIGDQIRYIAGEYLLITPKLNKITQGSNSVTLQWTAVSGADSYYVYRKTPGARWKQLATVSSSVSKYTDTSVSSGTAYTYTVRAETNGLLSGYDSAGLSVTALSAPNLTKITSTASGITINWSRVNGASGYYVYRKTAGGSWARIATISSGSTISYLDRTDLMKGTTYTYTVRAFAGKEYSAYRTSGISIQARYSVNVKTVSYVTTASLNYRDKAGTTGKVIGTLSRGTTVRVLPGRNVTVGGAVWYAIYLNDKIYYVNSNYLRAV